MNSTRQKQKITKYLNMALNIKTIFIIDHTSIAFKKMKYKNKVHNKKILIIIIERF